MELTTVYAIVQPYSLTQPGSPTGLAFSSREEAEAHLTGLYGFVPQRGNDWLLCYIEPILIWETLTEPG